MTSDSSESDADPSGEDPLPESQPAAEPLPVAPHVRARRARAGQHVAVAVLLISLAWTAYTGSGHALVAAVLCAGVYLWLSRCPRCRAFQETPGSRRCARCGSLL